MDDNNDWEDFDYHQNTNELTDWFEDEDEDEDDPKKAEMSSNGGCFSVLLVIGWLVFDTIFLR
ncbi:hypothetical protein D0T50_06215 [Bacteroides sp. 214]|uniref:hypothetical protein n=1 Tax=Bacteroides sp. 214 TaxID=2302935 RepID=UPI0013D22FFF|nr:hypothetical protein [Bacteroides sp. 214]NDW12484.1 hypothetical protein [Bacteroides sp. 214]